jgi:hypothetical protein
LPSLAEVLSARGAIIGKKCTRAMFCGAIVGRCSDLPSMHRERFIAPPGDRNKTTNRATSVMPLRNF